MTTEKCNRKDCIAEKQNYDNLFCSDCRAEWRRRMIDLGLAYCFREEILGPELKRFIERAEKPEETK
jgi:hypothetical protein